MNDNLLYELGSCKEIYLYGAGNIGKSVARFLMLFYPNISIKGILVTDLKNNPFSIYGIPVSEAGSVTEKRDAAILVSVAERSQEEIITYLKELGFINIYKIHDKLVNDWLSIMGKEFKYPEDFNYIIRYVQPNLEALVDIERKKESCNVEIADKAELLKKELYDTNRLYIPRLVVVLGTKCSLRCEECNNLMPYFKPQRDLDVSKIMASLKSLLNITTKVFKCELIGGEPFMSKNLDTMLEYLIDNPKIEKVEITTNGTLMPKDNIIGLLQNPKVQIRISDYGQLVDKTRIISFCTENKIDYHVLNLGKWISPGGVDKRNKDINDLRKEYSKCPAGYLCKTLYEDKLFSCARSASLFALGFMKETEYVQVDNTDREKIKDFILQDYSIACDYCDMYVDNKRYVDPAIQLE
jgi:hypothetical protein